MGQELSKEDMQELLEKFDKDADGEIGLDEFTLLVRYMEEHMDDDSDSGDGGEAEGSAAKKAKPSYEKRTLRCINDCMRLNAVGQVASILPCNRADIAIA